MANIDGRLSLALYDVVGGGGNFLVHVQVPDTVTLATIDTYLGTLKALYLTLGTGGIKEASYSFSDKSLASSPAASTSTGYSGVFDFEAGSPGITSAVAVPAFKPSLVSLSGTIDITATDPAAFVTAMTGAVMGGRFTNLAYATLNTGLDAFSSNRKRIRRVRP